MTGLRTCLLALLVTGCSSASEAPTEEDAGADVALEEGVDTATDASPVDTGSATDTTVPEAPPGTTAAFVAQGHAGRTTVSCDDGRTWVADRSDAPTIRCFEGGNDCDHDPGAGRGLTSGGGYFLATFGWGKPGSIRRSDDGVTWTKVLEGTTFGGMVWNDGFLAASRTGRVSKDLGLSWTNVTEAPTDQWNVRSAAFVEGIGAVMLLSDAKPDLVISADLGKTWRKPTTFPATCGNNVQGIAGAATAFAVFGADGVVCVSSDGGKTFTASNVGGTIDAAPVFTGKTFYAWGAVGGARQRFESADGKVWTKSKTSVRSVAGNGPDLGPVAWSASTGTFVGVKGGWMQWYEKQAFYRSEDGLVWDALPAGAFTPSHPIRTIAYGSVKKSAVCK